MFTARSRRHQDDPVTVPPPRPVVPTGLTDTIVGAVVLATLLAPFPGRADEDAGPAAIACTVASVLALPWRRRHPVAVLGVCLGLYAVLSALGIAAPGVAIATGVALFAVANRTPRRRTVPIAGGTIVLVLGLSILGTRGHLLDPHVIQPVLAATLAAVGGDGTRSRRALIAAITDRAERAELTREAEARRRVTEERLRIARDLHDTVAHQISVISLSAGVASSTLERDPQRSRAALRTVREAARTVLGEIGDLMAMLRSDEETDQRPPPQPNLSGLADLVAQFETAGLRVRLRIEGDLSDVTGSAATVAYRVVQEALTNAHKHGGEHTALVRIARRPNALRIIVDNPVTDEPGGGAGTADGSGFGLVGLRERVAAVRGTVETGPVAGGWKVSATIPLAPSAPPKEVA